MYVSARREHEARTAFTHKVAEAIWSPNEISPDEYLKLAAEAEAWGYDLTAKALFKRALILEARNPRG